MTTVIGAHVLLDIGGRREAPKAAAAQVFQLALHGYLKICSTKSAKTISLWRTDKPADDVPAEALYLLEALFADSNPVVLQEDRPVRVDQRLITIAHSRLLQEGMIRRVNLQKYEKWAWLAYFVSIGTLATIAVVLHKGVLLFGAIGASVLGMAIFSWLWTKRVWVTRQGKPARYWASRLYGECVTEMPDDALGMFDPERLPYELLWSPHTVPAAHLHVFDVRPGWWLSMWPSDPEKLAEHLRATFHAIAVSLQQERAPHKRLGWKIDKELEDRLERLKGIREILSGVSDNYGYAQSADGVYEGGDGHGDGGDGHSDGDGGGHGDG